MNVRAVPHRGVEWLSSTRCLALLGMGWALLLLFGGGVPAGLHNRPELHAALDWPAHQASSPFDLQSLDSLEGLFWHRRAPRAVAVTVPAALALSGHFSRVRTLARLRLDFIQALAFACAGSESGQATSLPPPPSA